MAGPRSLADRYRAHRAEMELAIELGITPKQARAEIDRREAWSRHKALQQRAAAMKAPPAAMARSTEDQSETTAPWWQRD